MGRRFSRRDFIGQARNVALATPFLSLIGCSEKDARAVVSLSGNTMGTTFNIKLVDLPENMDIDQLAQEIDSVLETVNQQMSTYRPDSELSRFNAATAGAWMPVSMDTRLVVDEALRVSQLTGGAFDPSVGPIVDLWGFGPGPGQKRVPSPEEVAALSESVGFAKVETRVDRPALRKQTAGLRLDLSGVAKGFGVDKVAALLEARGLSSHLVEVGGELRSSGHGPGGRAWRVGIEKPTAASGDLQRIIDLDGAALATSGNYRLFFESDGQSFSHIIDPASGRPVEHDLASATVVARTTMEADALSTSLLVLGPEAGMSFAREHGIAAYFVTGPSGSFSATASPVFEERYKT